MEQATSPTAETRRTFRDVPYMGVIYVVVEAMKLGFVNGHPDWSNLGQGQPEVGEIDGAPPRLASVDILPEDHAYGPLEGTPEIRELVAAHYNRLYRQGHASKYTANNVAIAQGGRLCLTRIAAALDRVRIGYQIPDYTAYEDLLAYHSERLTTVAFPTTPEDGWRLDPQRFGAFADDHGLDAFLLSNPCNPTGRVIAGDDLAAVVRTCEEKNVALLADEFYSHYIYTPDGQPGDAPVSAAAYLEDVERSPILIVDGLSKCYRYPGWRLGWVVGPQEIVESVARTASALDGGPSRIVQRAALEVLQPARADQETDALRVEFAKKRNELLDRLSACGIHFPYRSESTFYAWGSIADLPAPLNDAETFFRRALERKVMTVPGEYFDVNPGKLRPGPSPYLQWMRFSFGPPMDNLRQGLGRLEEMIAEARG